MYETDEIQAMQESINSGFCWQAEGYYGRKAMSFIEAGYCVLGPNIVSGGYGSPVGSRYDVVAGTKGSIDYAREQQPEFWAGRSVDWAD